VLYRAFEAINSGTKMHHDAQQNKKINIYIFISIGRAVQLRPLDWSIPTFQNVDTPIIIIPWLTNFVIFSLYQSLLAS